MTADKDFQGPRWPAGGHGLAGETACRVAEPELGPTPGPASAGLRPLAFAVHTQMDPRLQLALASRCVSGSTMGAALEADDEVAVLARVDSASAWAQMPDVQPGAVLGQGRGGGVVVTGRVQAGRVEAVRQHPAVKSLKASQRLQPALVDTVDAVGAGPRLPGQAGGGKGVVVGIVDFGGDFAHRNFRHADGRTRLLALWHQAGAPHAGSPFGYGRLYTAREIDAALSAGDPYAALGYGPRPDACGAGERGSHGTHVMDIAAGNGLGSGVAGVAPQAELVFVEAAARDIAWRGPRTVDHAFGDSAQLLEAVRFVFDTAGDRPCVVNVSLGTNGGPHDGSSLVEQGIDALLREQDNRCVVIAAGNAHQHGIHTSGEVPAGGQTDIGWCMPGAAGGELELWYPGGSQLQAELVAPDGTVLAEVAPGGRAALGSGGRVAVFVASRLGDPNNGDNMIGVWVGAGVAGGNWLLRLRSVGGPVACYHAWIERCDQSQSFFMRPVASHTLGSISTGHAAIVVGAYDARQPAFPISGFSSAGPTRDGRCKPDLAAPGQAVLAACSRTGGGVVRKSGTSMAAPAVTGLVALMLAESVRRGERLSHADIGRRLIACAHPPAAAGRAGAWDPRYGMGRARDWSSGPLPPLRH